jgi:murein DD-endopeptidase MepM/ murein hydrolase activator NlpD
MKLRVKLRAAWFARANDIAADAALVAAILFASGAIFGMRGTQAPAAPEAPPAQVRVAAAAPPPPAAPPAIAYTVLEGRLGRRETLGHALRGRDLSGQQVEAIVSGMSPVFNFRYAKVGDRYRATLDPAGELVRFDYERSPIERYSLRKGASGWVAEKHEPDVRVERAVIAGVVTTSLYESVVSLGESGELAHDYADIFAWDVDFSKSQSGDEFRALYERRFFQTSGGPTYLGPGRVLAARFDGAEGEYTAIYFETEPGRGGYYRPDGSAAQRQFLQAPLNYRRVSSQYAASRLHPILGVRRPHLGVDYAAPAGTPVWAVADGTVAFVGRNGGLGNCVRVRHAAGYDSLYGHLSGFARGMRVGQRVRQKQVVGFVGSTGLSTGPHLHFTLERNGKPINPSAVRMPQGDPIPASRRAEFELAKTRALQELDPTPFRIPTTEAAL